jgi:hypothetical protein
MVLGDGVTLAEAMDTGEHLGPWVECTICDISSICYAESCHNDGHWVEVAFPESTNNILDCQTACIAHDEATAFQYNGEGNDGGAWCGCMVDMALFTARTPGPLSRVWISK